MKSLDPHSGSWTTANLKTLLDRTMMGYSISQWKDWRLSTREVLIDKLLVGTPETAPPINTDFADDPYVEIGEAWINAPYPRGNKEALRYRTESLISWVVTEIIEKSNSIYPKMILFWHNHFPIEKMGDMRFNYDYYTLLNRHALGNFKQLTLEMTINPAMLRYLNGNRNTNTNPNENFARELLELFTIGKGEQVGEGDYTHYTEQDVQAIARSMTGWRDYGYYNAEMDDFGAVFRSGRHDQSDKTLSPRFDNATIPNLEADEYKKVIGLIFEKEEVARFISRKLFRWFVGSEIDEEVEANVIYPMGELIYNHDYEIRPALEALLNSRVFYDETYCGAIIKNPLEYLMQLFQHIEYHLDDSSEKYYQTYQSVFNASGVLGLTYFNIPQVAGWKAYYQGPAWYRHWITSTTLSQRNQIALGLLSINTRFDDSNSGADMLSLISEFDHPGDPNELIRELTLFMLPRSLTDEQISNLKEYFIPGLPDYEWTSEYNQLLVDPSDTRLRRSLNNKLKTLAYYIISLPDYQVI